MIAMIPRFSARFSFALVPVALLAFVSVACTPAVSTPSPARTSEEITPADVKSRIYLVADDSMAGRQAGTPGNYTMTSYLAKEMARVGLEPGGENGTWFQTIPMIWRRPDSLSTVTTRGERLRLFTDYAPMRPSPMLQLSSKLPSGTYETIYGGRLGDSSVALSPAQVNGRIIVLDAALGANGQPTSVYSTRVAAAIARYPGAAAVAVAALDLLTTEASTALRRGPGLVEATPRRTPFGFLVSVAAAEKIIGTPISTAKPGARGSDVTADIKFAEQPVVMPARNVIAILRGSDPALRGQYVAMGAHSDHIGIASRVVDHDSLRAFNRVMRPNGADARVAGSSTPTALQLAEIRSLLDSLRSLRPPRPDSINNGADDDGSGSVALLEIAESLSRKKAPRRSILFVWHTAEESGLLGSAWFTGHPTVPRDSIVAQLNMDMVGRGTAADTRTGGPRNIQVIGSRRLSTELGAVVDSVNADMREPYLIDYSFDVPGHIQNRYCRSDHYMYARAGIPIAYISRGYHPDYHMVTDEPQYISYDGLAKVADFMRNIAVALADRDDRVQVDKPKPDPLAPCQQ